MAVAASRALCVFPGSYHRPGASRKDAEPYLAVEDRFREWLPVFDILKARACLPERGAHGPRPGPASQAAAVPRMAARGQPRTPSRGEEAGGPRAVRGRVGWAERRGVAVCFQVARCEIIK